MLKPSPRHLQSAGPVRFLSRFLAAGFVASVIVLTPFAGNAAEDDAIVVTIGEREIRESDIALAEKDFGDGLAQYPEAQRRTILVDVMINLNLLADAAAKLDIAETEEFSRRLEYVRQRTLRDLYFEQEIESTVTPEAIEATYNEQIANIPVQTEIHARHILVETEDEAKAIVEALAGGADFEELAKEKSTGPSGVNGGDLGFFGENDMVPAFGTVAFALADGETSVPVQTQFGWHVIKVEERRDKALPALADVSDQIREGLLRDRFAEIINRLKAETTITIVAVDPSGDSSEPDDDNGEDQPASE